MARDDFREHIDDRSVRFLSLLKGNERRLNGYVLSLVHNWSDADDILQEVTIDLWRRFDEYDPLGDFGAWACTVAYYRILTYRKRMKRGRLQFSGDVDRLLDREIASMARQFSDHQDLLGRCLEKLAPRDRDFLRAYYSGTPIAVLAEKLARGAASLYKDLSNLRGALRKCVDGAIADEEARQ